MTSIGSVPVLDYSKYPSSEEIFTQLHRAYTELYPLMERNIDEIGSRLTEIDRYKVQHKNPSQREELHQLAKKSDTLYQEHRKICDQAGILVEQLSGALKSIGPRLSTENNVKVYGDAAVQAHVLSLEHLRTLKDYWVRTNDLHQATQPRIETLKITAADFLRRTAPIKVEEKPKRELPALPAPLEVPRASGGLMFGVLNLFGWGCGSAAHSSQDNLSVQESPPSSPYQTVEHPDDDVQADAVPQATNAGADSSAAAAPKQEPKPPPTTHKSDSRSSRGVQKAVSTPLPLQTQPNALPAEEKKNESDKRKDGKASAAR